MKRILAAMLCLFLLSACGSATGDESTDPQLGLWFEVNQSEIVNSESAISLEVRDWNSVPSVSQLMEMLLDGPENENLSSPFPEGLSVISLTVEDGTAVVDLSEQYGELIGYQLTLADYCIVLTLCQRNDIDSVRILVEGGELSYFDRQDLSAGDVMLLLNGDENGRFLAALYFPTDTGNFVVEYREIVTENDNTAEIDNSAEDVIKELLKGPDKAGEALPLPEGTELLSVSVSGRTCTVDLSESFASGAPDDTESATAMVYSVVNTLCSLSDINQVLLMCNGEQLDSYGPILLSEPLSATE